MFRRLLGPSARHLENAQDDIGGFVRLDREIPGQFCTSAARLGRTQDCLHAPQGTSHKRALAVTHAQLNALVGAGTDRRGMGCAVHAASSAMASAARIGSCTVSGVETAWISGCG